MAAAAEGQPQERQINVDIIEETVGRQDAGTGGEWAIRPEGCNPQTRIFTLYDVPLDDDFQIWLAVLCEGRGVDFATMVAMAEQESGFDPCAVGAMGEMGMWQVMPGTAAEVEEALGRRLDLFDPYDNADCASWLMGKYTRKYGNNIYALFAYSMGEAGAEECLKGHNPRSLYAVSVLEKAVGYVPRGYGEAGSDG